MFFSDIVGHEDIIRHFKSSIEMDRVSHAYIISGETGSGKKALARAFAATLQCETGTGVACETCQSCLQVISGNHPDIITVSHEKANVITVDEIREQLVDSITTKPYKSKYKIYIVPDAQLLNAQAQNAILKTIEEPPEYGIILLLTNNLDRLLSTIRSRCMVLETRPVRERDVLEYLTDKMGLSHEKAYFCLDFAQGNLGKAIRLAENDEYAAAKESVVDMLKRIPDMDDEDLTRALSEVDKFKLSLDDYMDLMVLWYRDILMLKVRGDVDKLLFKEEYFTLARQASILSYRAIEKKIAAIETAEQRIDLNANFDVVMGLLLATLKEI